MIHDLNGSTTLLNTLPKAQFVFQYNQYDILYKVELICTILSVVASVIVLIVYGYMLYYHPTDAQRVSLHCVIFAILVSLVNHGLDLKSLQNDVNTSYCHAFLIVDSILTLLTSSLLSMVGIHLFLLFVLDMKWPCRPEYLLIPMSLLYSFVGSLYCIFGTQNNSRMVESLFFEVDNFCWYYSNFVERTYEKKSWEYYYSFLFFITTLGFIFSNIALLSIYRVKKRTMKQFQIIEKTQIFSDVLARKNDDQESSFSSSSSDQQQHYIQLASNGSLNVNNKSIMDGMKTSKLQNTAFTKIVFRSFLYPCVPFIIHIWGFILQMQLINKDFTANFGLCMIGLIMACLEGVFLAFIFFSDPTVYTIPYEMYLKCIKSIIFFLKKINLINS
ncbi:unnamed protein product [Cunninghamella echinulata]